MNIHTTQNNDTVSIVLDDVFDFKHIDEFRKSYETIDPRTCCVIAVDFSSTRYMDSSALGMLLNIKNYFKDQEIQVKIVHPHDQIKKILSVAKFDQRFTIE